VSFTGMQIFYYEFWVMKPTKVLALFFVLFFAVGVF